ncbi:penicillin-binding protein activator [Alteraurantiacibacter aquimixticola]|uniref:Penicillin-binding protein activator n=1 Tax=Alteraurantiacibacter aquimixticola TaxID=2489173 RepID=A0A4T3EZA0_9SPHN|nr:penicillin-binding protein activator [Alteraurantiacibacter aquimixticola]TIX50091.1 penicillin-binding protein activator [Alteraurantiacibacter aquimixticola]
MFGNWKRGLAIVLGSMALAACQVIPGGEGGPVTGPVTGPVEVPDDTVLPQDAGRHRIALLVPLSGANGQVGQSIANATTMALLDTNAENIRITTYDTSNGAGTAASRAVQDGNALILGPLIREDVSAVLAQARPADVPLITFSNDTGVAARDVFVMGHVPEQSIERTVRFAIDQGARRFAVLVPNGEYGQRAAAALQRAVDANGATLVDAETYDRGNTSIVSAATRLNGRGGFDTVLIADGARLAAMAAGELKEAGEALPSIIGPELWSGETTLTRADAMEGAWFSAVSDGRYRQFANSYESRFGAQPYRIATLGYDAVLLTLRIARNWDPGEDFPIRQLADEGGFLGLDGAFRFRSDGVGERAFEVREVGDGDVRVVDAAPSQF